MVKAKNDPTNYEILGVDCIKICLFKEKAYNLHSSFFCEECLFFSSPKPMQQPHCRQTKIIATVGPASDSEERLTALYDAGVTIIRFNFSHAKQDHVREVMDRIRRLNASGRTRLATLADLKGPEIRTGDLDRKIPFQAGQHIRMYTNITQFSDDGNSLFCDYPYLVEDVEIGGTIEIESGSRARSPMRRSGGGARGPRWRNMSGTSTRTNTR